MKKCTCCKIIQCYCDYHNRGGGKFDARCKTCISKLQAMKYKRRKLTACRVAEIYPDRLELWKIESLKSKPNLLKKWIEGTGY